MTDIDRKTEKINRVNHRDDPLMELTKLFNLDPSMSSDAQTQNKSPRQPLSAHHQMSEGVNESEESDLSFLDNELENNLEVTFNDVNEAQDSRLRPAPPPVAGAHLNDLSNQPDFYDGAEQLDFNEQAPLYEVYDEHYADLDFSAMSEKFFSDSASNDVTMPLDVDKQNADQIAGVNQKNFLDPFGYDDLNSANTGQMGQFAEPQLRTLDVSQDSYERHGISGSREPVVTHQLKPGTFHDGDDGGQSDIITSERSSDAGLNENFYDNRDFGIDDVEAFDAPIDRIEQTEKVVVASEDNLESDFTTPIFPQVTQPQNSASSGYQPSGPLRFNNHIYSKVDESQGTTSAPKPGAGTTPHVEPLNDVHHHKPSQQPYQRNDDDGIEEHNLNRAFKPANRAQLGETAIDDRQMINPDRYAEFVDRPSGERGAPMRRNHSWAEDKQVQQQQHFFNEEVSNGYNAKKLNQSNHPPETDYDNAPLNEVLEEFQSSNLNSTNYQNSEKLTADQVPDVDTYRFEDERLKPIDNFELPPLPFEETPKKEFFDSLEYEFDDVFNVGHLQEVEKSKDDDQDSFFEDANKMLQSAQEGARGQSEHERFDATATNLHFDPNAQWGWNSVAANAMDRGGYSPRKTRRSYFLWGLLGLLIIFIGGGYYYSKSGRMGVAPAVIHADSSPYKVAAQPQDNKNHENIDVDAYESAAGHSEQNTQKVLVDTSEAPEDVTALNDKPPASTEDTIEQSGIDNAISSASNQVVPTRVVPSIIVKPEGSIVSSETKTTEEKTTSAPASETTGEDTIDTIVAESKNSLDSVEDHQTQSKPTPSTIALQSNQVNDTNTGSNQSATNETVAETGLPINAAKSSAPISPKTIAQRPTPTPITPKTVQPMVTRSAGSYYVQLASNPTQELAKISLAKAKSRFGSYISHLPIGIEEATIPNRGTYYRVRVQLGSRDEAVTLCNTLKQLGASCFVGR